jgi:hypothetical protein
MWGLESWSIGILDCWSIGKIKWFPLLRGPELGECLGGKHARYEIAKLRGISMTSVAPGQANAPLLQKDAK